MIKLLNSIRKRCPALRIVKLSRNRVTAGRLTEVEKGPEFNEVINDLIAYTGFPREKLAPYLLRMPFHHFESEFNWFRPKDEAELAWFYRCNTGYLYANATHPYVPLLDIIKGGKVLDYGAGVGCNTIGIAKRGLDVDFLEINRIQADFLNFRAARHALKNIREVLPYHNGEFDPVHCIVGEYDSIVAMDVLEHIPAYHLVVKHLVERLKPGGLFLENTPFHRSAGDIALHLREKVPLDQALAGMEKIESHVWRKRPY